MKMLFVERNAEEMRANRTIIDALTDVARSIVDTFNAPIPDDAEDMLEEAESEE